MNSKYQLLHERIGPSGISTPTLSDALDASGVASAVLPSSVTQLGGAAPGLVFGEAYTVSWVPVRKGPRIQDPAPSTWSSVRDFLVPDVTDGTGRVYVGGAGDVLTEGALAGGLSSTYLLEVLQFEAMVLGGAIRDFDVVDRLRSPVFASNFIPTDTQGGYRVESAGQSCRIGDVVVRTGDWVFADRNGVVVLGDDVVLDVVDLAVEIDGHESATLARVRAGERLIDLVDESGRI